MALGRNGFVQPVEGVAGGVPIPVSGGGVPANRATFAANQKTVPTPGTAVQLQTTAVPDGFTILVRALPTNTDIIWVGQDAATAQDHTKATPLNLGDLLTLALTNVNEIWIDANVSGEGISWTVEV
jgi:hypothetical protein